ncbi:ABC transporter permease [Skermania sp. ID1734]|nr:ABC transporter permease [Skermania sp. ID1734]
MRKVSLRNLAAHKVRLVLTLLSVVLGTAFIAGSFVFTDTLQHTFDGIFADQAKGVDVRVSGKDARSSGVPLADVQTIEKVPGVRAAVPDVAGPIVLIDSSGKAVQTGGAPTAGQSYVPPNQAIGEPQTFVAGTPPSKPSEIALNESGAKRANLEVGDHAQVLVPTRGLFPVTVSGIYSMPTDTGGFIAALFDASQARELFTDGQHASWIDVAGNGISQQDLRDRIAKVLPTMKVQTGDEVRDDMKSTVEKALSFINYFLLAFGAIALVVGTFIIYNTFSMIVAQRLRELALLRAVGASRQQVARSVLLEASIVGLVGSAVGVAAGVGLAYGLRGLLNAFNVGLPSGALQVEPRTIIVGLVVGVVVTMLSAYAPARRAAKIPPVEAMRAEFATAGDSLRLRTLVGAVLAVIGVVVVIVGSMSTGGGAAATVGVGAGALIFAVLFAAPALARPLIGALGAVVTRPFGPIGQLARNNAVRNPKRTAATAFALTLGLMLVSVIAMFGSSAKASVDTLVNNGVEADFVLTGPPLLGVPIPAAQAAAQVSGVQTSAALHPAAARLGDENVTGTALSGSLDGLLRVNMNSGTATLSGNSMLVSQTQATQRNWHVGEDVTFTSFDNKPVIARVTGIYADNQLLGNWMVGDGVYPQITPSNLMTDAMVFLKANPGTNLDGLRSRLEQATDPFAIVSVQDREQFKGEQAKQIDTLLAVLYGLLALAIVIAVLGIINTLALSVVERRREIGMLRAVGMQRAQVRRSIYLESMLIAVFGAAIGVVLGLSLGTGFIRTLHDRGLTEISVPWLQVVALVVGSAVVGVLAALWPAVGAARTRPLEAIADV